MTRVRIERIRPKGGLLLDEKAVNRELAYVVGLVATSMRRQANETVATWEEKPPISTQRRTTGDRFYVQLDIDSDVWHYLDKGTEPHVIRAKNKPNLVFRVGGFVAKSKPGQFRSGAGQAASGGFIAKKSVQHPGIKARKWSVEIKRRSEELASREMIKALDRIVKSRKKG